MEALAHFACRECEKRHFLEHRRHLKGGNWEAASGEKHLGEGIKEDAFGERNVRRCMMEAASGRSPSLG